MKHLKKLAFAALLAFPVSGFAAATSATLYKNPNCGCCSGHAEYLKENGFDVEVVNTNDLSQLKAEHNVPERLAGCHTTLIDDYVFEGHVNAESIRQVLDSTLFIKGLSVPGMPAGSPGMGGEKQGPIEVYVLAFQPTDSPDVYATY